MLRLTFVMSLSFSFLSSASALLTAQTRQCAVPGIHYERITDHYYFSASSAQGAVGDVVGVDIAVQGDAALPGYRLWGLQLDLCYDDAKLELLDEVYYPPEHDQIFGYSGSSHADLYPVASAPPGTRGYSHGGSLWPQVRERLFPSPSPVPLLTLFFRIEGSPGETTQVRFCDNELQGPAPNSACLANELWYDGTVEGATRLDLIDAQSTRHQPGTIRILSGPTTQPNPPPLPPNAEVYPEAPTPERANIKFELTGAVAQPGATSVPLKLYATSNYEFSGFAVSLKFPAEYLELAQVEEHTRPGVVRIDSETGYLGLYLSNTRRRIGAEGERVHLATLSVNLKPTADTVTELACRFEDHDPFVNWLQIHYQGDRIQADPLPYTAEVSPFVVANAVLKIQRHPTVPGDVNLDYNVNLADAIAILEHLFTGKTALVCPPAADFNADRQVNITDPVALLRYLFLGGPPAPERAVDCRE